MNNKEFTYLLNKSANIDASKTQQLDELIQGFPYFQLARAIQLKGLNNSNSFKYNAALKKTAAYTIDRKVLFDFITSQNFSSNLTSKVDVVNEIEIVEPKTTELSKEKEDEDEDEDEEILELGKPIEFNYTEPHSFNEWMQLISQKPIQRDENSEKSNEKPSKTEEKFNLIKKFIETNPKIKPSDKNAINQQFTHDVSSENESLMTETLAKVYLEQKKYESAIKAYHILSLKYPEKSGFFADRIKAIKNLQINKS